MEEGKFYYKIGDIAEALGVTKTTIRYWEKEFPTLKPDTNTRGVRLYKQKDVDLLRKIKFLVYDKGFSIAGARREINSMTKSATQDEVLNTLLEAKRFLERLKQTINETNK